MAYIVTSGQGWAEQVSRVGVLFLFPCFFPRYSFTFLFLLFLESSPILFVAQTGWCPRKKQGCMKGDSNCLLHRKIHVFPLAFFLWERGVSGNGCFALKAQRWRLMS